VNRAGVKRINGTFGPLIDIKSLIFSAIPAGLMRRIFRQHADSMSAIKINSEKGETTRANSGACGPTPPSG